MSINLECMRMSFISAYLVLNMILAIMVHYNIRLREHKAAINKELMNLNKEDNTLKEELSEVNTIITTLEDAIICSKLDGTIIRWNEGARGIYGYTKEEAIGRNISIISKDKYVKEIEWLSMEIKGGKVIKGYETERNQKHSRRL